VKISLSILRTFFMPNVIMIIYKIPYFTIFSVVPDLMMRFKAKK